MPQPAKRPSSPEFDWQKQRLKTPDKMPLPGCGLVRGYGPEGNYSLYLPTNRNVRRLQFSSGKPAVITETTPLETPTIKAAREAVLRSATLREAPTVADFLTALQGDVSLAAYSAALLALNYDLSDDDLTMLHTGRRWYDPLLQHAIGGQDAVEALARISPATISRVRSDSEYQLTRSLAATQDAPPQTAADPVEVVAAMVAAGELVDLSMD